MKKEVNINKNKYSISCIIVNYNNSKYLRRSIDSLLNQTRIPDEIIISDDHSTDNSIAIIKEYSNKYNFIKTIFRKSNIGVSANRDLAIKSSRCDLFTTLDSDDILYPAKLENELKLIKNVNDIAVSNIALIDEFENVLDVIEIKNFTSLSNDQQLSFLIKRKKGMPRDMLLHKKLYLEVGGMRHTLELYEDWDLKIRLNSIGVNWKFSDYIGVGYRRIGKGLSSKNQLIHMKYKFNVLIFNLIRTKNKLSFINSAISMFIIKGFKKLLSKDSNAIH